MRACIIACYAKSNALLAGWLLFITLEMSAIDGCQECYYKDAKRKCEKHLRTQACRIANLDPTSFTIQAASSTFGVRATRVA